MARQAPDGRSGLRLNASFVACASDERGPHQDCFAAALQARGLQLGSPVAFEEQVRSVAALSIDGNGYQASLGALLALGVVVVAPPSRFPTWIEPLLRPDEHLLRPSLAALPDALRWLAQRPADAAALASRGQRRACALLHAPHVAGYLARLLRAYAAGFAGPCPPALHARVGRLAPTSPAKGGLAVMAAEALWFRKLRRKYSRLRADGSMRGTTGASVCDQWWVGSLNLSKDCPVAG